MKKFFYMLFLLMSLQAASQKENICFVTSVNGVVQKNGKQLRVGDTIHFLNSLSMRKQLQINAGARIIFMHPSYGSFVINDKYEALNNENIDSLFSLADSYEQESKIFEGLLEIFRLKASKIKLSSRGDCDEKLMNDYLKTDPEVNDRILLIDSLCLPLTNSNEGVPVNYYLQWKYNNVLINKKLKVVNNKIIITPADLVFDTIVYNDEESAIKLATVRYRSTGKSFEPLATLRPHCISSEEIKNYYGTLGKLMPDTPPKELFERFYNELYIFYGKPDICYLKTVVGYKDN